MLIFHNLFLENVMFLLAMTLRLHQELLLLLIVLGVVRNLLPRTEYDLEAQRAKMIVDRWQVVHGRGCVTCQLLHLIRCTAASSIGIHIAMNQLLLHWALKRRLVRVQDSHSMMKIVSLIRVCHDIDVRDSVNLPSLTEVDCLPWRSILSFLRHHGNIHDGLARQVPTRLR